MSGLRYREDADEVRNRLTHWWQGGSLGRPPLLITVPRERPLFELPARSAPAGWVTHYSKSDFDYRLHLALSACDTQSGDEVITVSQTAVATVSAIVFILA